MIFYSSFQFDLIFQFYFMWWTGFPLYPITADITVYNRYLYIYSRYLFIIPLHSLQKIPSKYFFFFTIPTFLFTTVTADIYMFTFCNRYVYIYNRYLIIYDLQHLPLHLHSLQPCWFTAYPWTHFFLQENSGHLLQLHFWQPLRDTLSP